MEEKNFVDDQKPMSVSGKWRRIARKALAEKRNSNATLEKNLSSMFPSKKPIASEDVESKELREARAAIRKHRELQVLR